MKTNFWTLYFGMVCKPKCKFDLIFENNMAIIVHNSVKSIMMIGFAITTISLKAQDVQKFNYLNGLEISTGFSILIYQSAYGFMSSQGVEVLVSKRLGENFKTETGFRTSLSSFFSEGFIRGVVYNHFNSWQPLIGFETGITKRADFATTSNLLKESREAMLKDIGNSYFSAHVELLSFNMSEKLNISLLELDIGSHYKHFGRTLRAQTTLIRIRKTF